MLNPDNSHLPIYQQIQYDIEFKINNGEYICNQMIPHEHELCAIYNVSRNTIQKALKVLVDNRILTRVKGHGTYVSRRKILQKFIISLDNYNREMLNKGIVPRTRVLEHKVISADDQTSLALEIKKGDPLFKLVRVRYADGLPILYVTTYVPFIKASFVYEVDFEKESLYETLAAHNIYISSASRTLEIRQGDATLSKELLILANDPLFYFETVALMQTGAAMEYSQCYYRGDVNEFKINSTV